LLLLDNQPDHTLICAALRLCWSLCKWFGWMIQLDLCSFICMSVDHAQNFSLPLVRLLNA